MGTGRLWALGLGAFLTAATLGCKSTGSPSGQEFSADSTVSDHDSDSRHGRDRPDDQGSYIGPDPRHEASRGGGYTFGLVFNLPAFVIRAGPKAVDRQRRLDAIRADLIECPSAAGYRNVASRWQGSTHEERQLPLDEIIARRLKRGRSVLEDAIEDNGCVIHARDMPESVLEESRRLARLFIKSQRVKIKKIEQSMGANAVTLSAATGVASYAACLGITQRRTFLPTWKKELRDFTRKFGARAARAYARELRIITASLCTVALVGVGVATAIVKTGSDQRRVRDHSGKLELARQFTAGQKLALKSVGEIQMPGDLEFFNDTLNFYIDLFSRAGAEIPN